MCPFMLACAVRPSTRFARLRAKTAIILALLSPLVVQADPIQLRTEIGQGILLNSGPQRTFLRIGLEGLEMPSAERPPINVALVLDRSGSMKGERMEQAKQAAFLALDYLRPADTVAVVAYDDAAEVLVPSAPFVERQYVEHVVGSIRAQGRTALHDGVVRGAEELHRYLEESRVNRMVLLSDGQANVGPSRPDELGALGVQLGRAGISVTTVGLGLGYNEDLMAALSSGSDGNHVFAETPDDLADAFRSEFGELVSVIAGDITIIIDCRNGVRPLRILGRNAIIEDGRVIAHLNQLYAKQEKYLLLEVEVPAGKAGSELDLASVKVTFNNLRAKTRSELSGGIRARFSGSADDIAESINKSVMVSAAEQIGAEMDGRVLKLKDQGNVAGAAAVLREKTEYLSGEASKLQSDHLQAQSERAKAAEAAIAAPSASDTWSRARKEIRSDQHGIQNQQSYR